MTPTEFWGIATQSQTEGKETEGLRNRPSKLEQALTV